jgi:60 kDa SS-A/Ro ribonucleoprotein
MSYLKEHTATPTPQTEPLPGQIRNQEGGFSWEVPIWDQFRRFLILGTQGGSYYKSERDQTKEAFDVVDACLADDPSRAVREIVEVSTEGLALRNDQAIYALAKACAHADESARQEACDAIPSVCRTGTHLFMFCSFVENFRGWGKALQRGVASWYNGKDPKDLAYQMTKYRQRDGWTHRDVLRLAHPTPVSEAHDQAFAWACGKLGVTENPDLSQIVAFQTLQNASVSDAIVLIRKERMTREMVPTEMLTNAGVWEALLDSGMPLTAMVRNLGNLTKSGVLTPMSDGTKYVLGVLGDAEKVQKSKIHPFAVLLALKTYASGQGMRGSGTWDPVPKVVEALDAAYYTAFKNVEPTGARWLLGCDISSSMTWGSVAGTPLTPAEATGAMAMVTAAVEDQVAVMGFAHDFRPLDIVGKRLDDVLDHMYGQGFGGTDCSLPMLWAMEKGLEVDCFVVYTDSETRHGSIHPAKALEQYRQKTGIPARLIVCAMVANKFTIADPKDLGMLDIVGADSSTPKVIAMFGGGQI